MYLTGADTLDFFFRCAFRAVCLFKCLSKTIGKGNRQDFCIAGELEIFRGVIEVR